MNQLMFVCQTAKISDYYLHASKTLQDPFELNRNVSGGFGESGFKRFMYYCKKAEDILENSTHNKSKKEDEENLAGVLRLFEIPAPPTPKDTRRGERGRGAAYRLMLPNMSGHVPFKQKMSTLISLFAKEFCDDSGVAAAEDYYNIKKEAAEEATPKFVAFCKLVERLTHSLFVKTMRFEKTRDVEVHALPETLKNQAR